MEKKETQKKKASPAPVAQTAAVKARAPKKEATPKTKTKTQKPSRELSANVYDANGKELRALTLSADTFGVSWNADLVHQVVLGMENNARAGRAGAHTKGRGEVRGGGRKPWRQKGTGRARHGSIRSPIWIGGGVTHGPKKDKDYSSRIPKKMRVKALLCVLSRKLAEGEILFVDALPIAQPSTRDAKKALSALSRVPGFETLLSKGRNAGIVLTPRADTAVKKSFRNFSNWDVEEMRNLNAVDALSHTYLMIVNPEESLTALQAKLS
jgi:large subunit ribosomal protein L4